MTVHCVIPDTQVKPGLDLSHLAWAGQYIAEKKPDVIIHIGDHADMPSLSEYDRGKKSFEGRTYKADVEAAKEGMECLLKPIRAEQKRLVDGKRKQWNPRMVLTMGNHENRINRAIENDRKLEGLISTDDLGYAAFGWEVIPFLEPIVIDGVAYCLAKHHKVLTRDLTYIPLANAIVGTELFAFDEHADPSIGHRKYKTATVTKHSITQAMTYRVTMDNGKVFEATKDHRWLARTSNVETTFKWKHTFDLKVGDMLPKLQDEWSEDETKAAGWLAGMFDGEGWVTKPNCKQGGMQLGIAQNDGATLSRIHDVLGLMGASFNTHVSTSRCSSVRVLGKLQDKIKLLGKLRPMRLIEKFKPEMLGRVQQVELPKIVSIEPYIEQDIVQIETTTGTLIVEGYGHHNCHYFTSGVMGRPVASARALAVKKHMSCSMGHVQATELDMTQRRGDGVPIIGLFAGIFYQHEETYMDHQSNQQHRQIWMKHEVCNGHYYPMPVSLEYLRKRYAT